MTSDETVLTVSLAGKGLFSTELLASPFSFSYIIWTLHLAFRDANRDVLARVTEGAAAMALTCRPRSAFFFVILGSFFSSSSSSSDSLSNDDDEDSSFLISLVTLTFLSFLAWVIFFFKSVFLVTFFLTSFFTEVDTADFLTSFTGFFSALTVISAFNSFLLTFEYLSFAVVLAGFFLTSPFVTEAADMERWSCSS